MGDADAVPYVEMGPTPSLSVQCHDCKAEKLRLEDQARAYREWIIQDSKADKEAYRKQVMAEYAVAKEKLREQVEDELVSEIEAQFTEQCEAWKAEINKGHADEINEANKAKAAVWRRVKGLEKQISDMEEASAVRDATLRQLQSGLQPAQGSLARPSQPPRSALRQPSQAGEQSAARPQGPVFDSI
ncbi:hypothetical protein PENDEC_c041G05988 [Penicillium decumbens]|uniref:Uncharacterized protein n=1 Tax=Penicillium decumbens TaxID=69771 RepID=A0A1V6NR85_PENDC|nr:hypothetical protein PENDEC_c041G05988 [Penicillium decumbens]